MSETERIARMKSTYWHVRGMILAVCGLLFMLLAAPAVAQVASVSVTFQVNDAVVKGKMLADVSVGIGLSETGDLLAQGKTGPDGRFTIELQPGRYFASFGKRGYIPLANTVVEVAAGRENLVTVTLSMMMEAVGPGAPRRVQIVLNWGSRADQVRDADSHLLCSRGGRRDHVYFGSKNQDLGEHTASLDVDDTDGGGPETITLQEPLPGSYTYWVHNYSGLPARLDESDVVVRVMIDNAVAGEYRMASATPSRIWRPFRLIQVDAAGNPVIEPFTPDELASRADLLRPDENESADQDLGVFGTVLLIAGLIIQLVVLYGMARIFRRIWRVITTGGNPDSV